MKTAFRKKTISAILALISGVVLSIVGLYYYHLQYLCYEYTVLQFILAAVVCLGGALLSVPFNKGGDKKKSLLNATVTALAFAVVLVGLMLLINGIVGNGELNTIALIVPVYLSFIITTILVIFGVSRIFGNRPLKAFLLLAVIAGFAVGSYSYIVPFAIDVKYEGYKSPTPVLSTQIKTEDDEMIIGDYYVSTNGNDSNSGTKAEPFLTIERAIEAVRNTENTNGITVCIEAGEYRVSSLEFTKDDSGSAEHPIKYCAYNGEVVINGGVTLSCSDFKPVSEYPTLSERLTSEARENVVVVDLTKAPYSLTQEDWGKIYAIGSYHTAESYDGDYTGELYCELFINDKRQTLARYPDDGFLFTEEVVSRGLSRESDGEMVENWDEIRNPEADVYRINPELAKRIVGWQTLDDVWMFGFWKYDWADASSPIGSFNTDTGELSPKFVSLYGTKEDAPYYFFNVLEELSTAGEWYLDREKGLLCLWKPENFEDAQIDLSLSLKPIINAEADNLIFDGFTVKGTRSDAVIITGDNNTVRNCLIKNVAGNALVMYGSNNLACNNEITRTGKGGIYIEGGDTETLTAGNSKADNNYIHDWSEIYQTYQPAVTLAGVGNICSHNEMHDSPHEAITYRGNNHIIEYNNIHDVCLLSDDAGAIYSGRSWVWYGNVVRYNCIYNVGSENHAPDGIYLDDALSGQQIYGNLLINIPRNSIHIGGGRDNLVTNNIIVNSGENAVYFDERARDGALNNGWFTHAYIGSGDMWAALYDSPWNGEIWQTAFPEYKTMTDDISQSETAEYIPNPASTVKGNIIVNKNREIGDIHSSAYRFSDISDNKLFHLRKADDLFADIGSGNYNIRDIEILRESIPGFENIPLEKIGRVN